MSRWQNAMLFMTLVFAIAIAAALGRVSERLDAIQSTAEQTVDFLSDIHAERSALGDGGQGGR